MNHVKQILNDYFVIQPNDFKGAMLQALLLCVSEYSDPELERNPVREAIRRLSRAGVGERVLKSVQIHLASLEGYYDDKLRSSTANER